jgi:hypothetical protein
VDDPARPSADRLGEALRAPAAVDAGPSDPPVAVRADPPVRQLPRQPVVRTRARTRQAAHVRARVGLHRPRDGAVRGRSPRRDARGGVPAADPDRTARWRPHRLIPGIDQRSRDAGVWLGHVARTRLPPGEPRPLEEPLSAPTPPLAATFPHTLPGVRQIAGPFCSAAVSLRAQPVTSEHSSFSRNWQSCNVTRSPEPRAIRLTRTRASALGCRDIGTPALADSVP